MDVKPTCVVCGRPSVLHEVIRRGPLAIVVERKPPFQRARSIETLGRTQSQGYIRAETPALANRRHGFRGPLTGRGRFVGVESRDGSGEVVQMFECGCGHQRVLSPRQMAHAVDRATDGKLVI